MVAMAQTLPVLMGGLDLSVGCRDDAGQLPGQRAGQRQRGADRARHRRLPGRRRRWPAWSTGSSSSTAASSRSSPRWPPGPIYIGIALFIRPTPGGEVDGDLSWAVTNELSEFCRHLRPVRRRRGGLAEADRLAAGAAWCWHRWSCVLVWLPFRNSVTGRGVYAIGSAEGAAYMSGVRIDRCKLAAFTLAGFFAGIGGLFLALQTCSGNADVPQAGAYTLNSIAAVVIGGTSLMGGSGGAIGSMIGALVLRSHLVQLPHLRDRPAAAAAGRGPRAAGRRQPRRRPGACASRTASSCWAEPAMLTALRRRPADRHRQRLHPGDPRGRHRLHAGHPGHRQLPVADLPAAAAAGRRLPRHRRRRHDAGHPARATSTSACPGRWLPARCWPPPSAARWPSRSASASACWSAWSTASASPICACRR